MATAFEAKTAVEPAKLLPTVVPIVSFFKCFPKHLLFRIFSGIFQIKYVLRIFPINTVKTAHHTVVYVKALSKVHKFVWYVLEHVHQATKASNETEKWNTGVRSREVGIGEGKLKAKKSLGIKPCGDRSWNCKNSCTLRKDWV